MKYLILLTTFVLTCQLVRGDGHAPTATVYCNNDHTVDIQIDRVDDADEWDPDEWRLEDNPACDPTINVADQTVNYENLTLPDCSTYSIQNDGSIKYILKIEARKPDPGSGSGSGSGFSQQVRAYDHLYFVSCEYDNQNRSIASFVPIVNRRDNDTDDAFFTFSLQAFPSDDFTGVVPDPIELDEYLYFKAYVDTQSAASNLDLYIVKCFSSSSADPTNRNANNVNLIVEGCGNRATSQDLDDTLMYTCTSDSIYETFKLKTFRYFGFREGSKVYIHCELRVCLADVPDSACDCPTDDECDPNGRKRRSLEDVVDETQVYRVTSGPFTFKSRDDSEVNEEEGGADGLDNSQSFSTNLVVIVVVSGVVAVAVCATIFFVVRSRNKRQQHGDLSIPT